MNVRILMACNVYSLPDCKSVLYHPDVGTANLHRCGMGKIVVSAAGDLTSHTTTADGYIVVNKLKTTHRREPAKVPDRTFDRTGTNLTYTLLATTITEQ